MWKVWWKECCLGGRGLVIGDSWGSDLWLSKQSQGLVCGVWVYSYYSAEPPALPMGGKWNLASWKIASSPKLEKCSVPTCFLLASDFLLQSKCIFIVLPVWLRLERIPYNPCTGFLWFETPTCTYMHAHTCSHFILTGFPGGESPL